MYDNLTRINLEFAHREAEKRIEELEKENEILKGDLELWESGGCRTTNLFKCGIAKELKEQLTKAKEIIKDCIHILKQSGTALDWKYAIDQAEQYLKEIKE